MISEIPRIFHCPLDQYLPPVSLLLTDLESPPFRPLRRKCNACAPNARISVLYWLSFPFLPFQIVPMLNPDGVIVGNTRCSLAARDLNRQYKSVIKEAFPPVYHVKSLIRKCD